MEELKKILLTKYDGIIEELEKVDILCKKTLEDATLKGDYTEADISLLSVFAKDNYEQLQLAKIRRDLINKY
jgi:hypothetical protein